MIIYIYNLKKICSGFIADIGQLGMSVRLCMTFVSPYEFLQLMFMLHQVQFCTTGGALSV